MGILSDILQWQAQNVFCDPDRTLAEPITYAACVAGVLQAPVSLNVPIDRSKPITVGPENTHVRTRTLGLFVPGGGVVANVSLGDLITAAWRIGSTPEKFRVVEILNADAGGWEILAEASAT